MGHGSSRVSSFNTRHPDPSRVFGLSACSAHMGKSEPKLGNTRCKASIAWQMALRALRTREEVHELNDGMFYHVFQANCGLDMLCVSQEMDTVRQQSRYTITVVAGKHDVHPKHSITREPLHSRFLATRTGTPYKRHYHTVVQAQLLFKSTIVLSTAFSKSQHSK